MPFALSACRVRARLRPLRLSATLAAVAAIATAPCAARASGFETEYPDNGARALGRAGAFVARADDGSAIYYNPAGLTRQDGTNLYISANVMSLNQTFQPADAHVAQGNKLYTLKYGQMEQSLPVFVAPMLACQFDFAALPDFDFAAGVYGPAADGHRKFPDQFPVKGATYVDRNGATQDAAARLAGGQAALTPNGMLVESTLTQIFPTLSVAWQSRDANLRLGLSLQDSIVIAQLKQGSGGAMPGQALLDVKDLFSPTGVLGVQYAPHPRFELGLSFRPPVYINASGTAKLRRYAPCPQAADGTCKADPSLSDKFPLAGELPLYAADEKSRDNGVTMKFENPLWARLGVRYVHRSETVAEGQTATEATQTAKSAQNDPGLFDVELDYIYERDSTHKFYDITFDAKYVNIPVTGDASAQGTDILMPHLKDQRHYQDTHEVRLGGDFNVLPGELAVRCGTAYETAVSPENYTHIDFPSTAKVTGAVGVGYAVSDLVELDLGLSYTHFMERTVKDSAVRLTDVQTTPSSWAINGNGTFAGHYMVLGLSTNWHL